jgi:hypothetical protein
MSGTLKVTTLQDGASATANMVFDTLGNTTAGGTLAMASSFKRNRIINGNMLIDQRNAGVAQINVSSGAFICDRFYFATSQNSKWSLQQLSISDLAGFTKAAYVTISTTYTTGTADFAIVDGKIEGLNVADLGWGTASAKTVTLSFWVKTNIAGTYGVTILNGGATRSYPATYTVSASATWQQVTITIAGDTTGTWATDNTTGIWLRWGLGSGSNYAITTPNVWGTSGGYQPSGGAVISGNTGGYWEMTGVQLEVGTKATPYEMQIYSDQLAQCQRYYQFADQGVSGAAVSSTVAILNYYPPVQFRTAPTIGITAPAKVDFPYTTNYTQSSASVGASFASINGGQNMALINFSGMTANSYLVLRNDGGKLTFSAEL